MDGELIFRILFFVLFLAGSAIRGYYARKKPKKRSPRERLKETAQAESVLLEEWRGAAGITTLRQSFGQHEIWRTAPVRSSEVQLQVLS